MVLYRGDRSGVNVRRIVGEARGRMKIKGRKKT